MNCGEPACPLAESHVHAGQPDVCRPDELALLRDLTPEEAKDVYGNRLERLRNVQRKHETGLNPTGVQVLRRCIFETAMALSDIIHAAVRTSG